MVPPSSRHQQLNLYPSSDQNTQLSSPRHTQSPGIINKWFFVFLLFCFYKGSCNPDRILFISLQMALTFWSSCLHLPGFTWNYMYVPPCQVYAMLQLKPRVSYALQECSANRDTCPALGSHFLKISTLGERGLAYPLLPQLVRTKTPSWFHSFTH